MNPSARSALDKVLASDAPVLAVGLAYFLVIWPVCPGLASRGQAVALLENAAPLLVLALGQMLVLLVGGIDLSVSGLISLSGVVGALVMADGYGKLAGSPAAVPAGLAAMVAIGLVVGGLHGVAVARLEMPPFLVTLASMMILGAAALGLTGSGRLARLPTALLDAAQGTWLGVPVTAWGAVGLAVALHLVLGRTMLGRQLVAIGQGAKTAKVSGLPVARATVAAFAACGACSAIAAIVYTARSETASPAFARDVLLDAIGAAVLGGTSLGGGRASVPGVVLGTLLITLVGNSLTLLNLDYWHVLMVKGGVILLAALGDGLRRRHLGGEGAS